MEKQRLDNLLLVKGLAPTKSLARAMIIAGEVKVDDRSITKPGTFVSTRSKITIKDKMPYVSRGGLKLEYALNKFNLDVRGLIALDVGASTGGFTDCLLQHGAHKVYALDVGYGQIDYKLRQDPRVIVMEKVNAHYPFELPEKVDITTVDVSFISVTKVIPNITPHLKEKGLLLILFKPQFEAMREEVGKGGIIKDPRVHTRIIGRFFKWAIIDYGLNLINLTTSPVEGADGNKEFLILFRLFPPIS